MARLFFRCCHSYKICLHVSFIFSCFLCISEDNLVKVASIYERIFHLFDNISRSFWLPSNILPLLSELETFYNLLHIVLLFFKISLHFTPLHLTLLRQSNTYHLHSVLLELSIVEALKCSPAWALITLLLDTNAMWLATPSSFPCGFHHDEL